MGSTRKLVSLACSHVALGIWWYVYMTRYLSQPSKLTLVLKWERLVYVADRLSLVVCVSIPLLCRSLSIQDSEHI